MEAIQSFLYQLAVSFDLPILEWIQAHLQCGFMDTIMPIITLFGEGGIFWIAWAVILLIIPKTRKTGLSMIIALLLGQREDSKFHVNQALVIWIASLLGVTAYAAGWLGLSSRVQPAPPLMSAMPDPSDPAATPFAREPGGFISANGYANSPAALAHKEWHEFWFSYTDSHPEMFEG